MSYEDNVVDVSKGSAVPDVCNVPDSGIKVAGWTPQISNSVTVIESVDSTNSLASQIFRKAYSNSGNSSSVAGAESVLHLLSGYCFGEAAREVVCEIAKNKNINASVLTNCDAQPIIENFPIHVVFAKEQTSGRGRLGREWKSVKGGSFVASFVFAVPTQLAQGTNSGWITSIAGLAVLDALRGVATAAGGAGLTQKLVLKWPNDIYCEGKKLGGILSEAVHFDSDNCVVIVGVGLNIAVNSAVHYTENTGSQSGATVLQEFHATSLDSYIPVSDVTRTNFDLCKAIVRNLRQRMTSYLANDDVENSGLLDERKANSWTLGKHVTVRRPDGSIIEGFAQTILPNGALVIKATTPEPEGQLIAVTTADVGVMAESDIAESSAKAGITVNTAYSSISTAPTDGDEVHS